MVFRHGIKPSDALEVIEVIIKLLCAKNIRVVRGTNACTDGVGTVYLPPLPPDSTEEDQVLFLGYGLHEGSHFTAKSDPKLMSKIKLQHSCENGVDDVRSERDMENKKPGVTYWRKLWYEIFFRTELSKTFPVQTKENIADFLHKLICLMIFRTRSQQLDMELHLNPSAELQEAYDEYILDLEPMIKRCDTFKEALRVGGILYDRIKKLIKDDVAGKTPDPKKPEKKEKKDDKEPSDSDKKDSGGDSGPGESDPETSPESSGSEAEDTTGEDAEEKDSTPGAEGDTGEPEGSDRGVDPGEKPSEPDDKSAEVRTSGDESKEADDSDGDSDTDAAAEAEYKEACKKRDRKIDEETKRVLREIEGSPDDKFEMPVDIWAKEINRVICRRSGPYMVAKGVRDIIEYVPEGDLGRAEGIKKVGINLLGTKGDLMTRLFISQTKSRTIYNQRSGSFDMTTFMQDASDSRMDLYTEEIPGCLDKAAISFMMDNSSSMGGVIEKAYALLSGFMHYLCKAAIPVEAVGFTADICRNPSYRDVPVYLQIIKKFEDGYDSKVIRRCVPPRHMHQNAEVDCLRWMVPRLLKRPEGKKILFVVGDGQPCIGCDDINEKLAYAYKEYLELCRKAGIIVFGFGINCDLSEYFGEDFLSVESSDMGDIILKKLTEILNRKRVQ